MVSSLLVDALSSPTDALNFLYESLDRSALTDFPKAVSKHFSDIFKTDEAFSEIPPLTPSRPPSWYNDRSLVRFRAMVQDTSPSPEMYLSKLRSGKAGGWGIFDLSEEGASDGGVNYADLRDCTVVWAVSVPGENEWYGKTLDGELPASIDHRPGGAETPRHHKYPIAAEPHVGVQLKIYDSFGNDAPKTADVMNFVGILTTEPLHTESDIIVDVPTLHVLFTRPHALESVSFKLDASVEDSLRGDLVSWIADEALGGDRDAAQWVLLASIARVQSRTRSLNPPPVTLSHFPSPRSDSTTPTLSHVLELLFPLTVTLPLSLELLNKVPFTPESKQEDLHSGVLQLAQGTTLLVTESGVQEGKLVEQGVLNVMAVQNVMSSQTLSYKFPFSEFSFPTDTTFVILAQGSKSAFWKTDITLPLDPAPSSNFYKPLSDVKLPPPDKLAAFRRFLLDAKTGKIEVSEVTSEYIQNDFVQERKADSSISSEDLKQTITVARLLGLSMGEKEVSIDVWKRAKELEKRRKARFA